MINAAIDISTTLGTSIESELNTFFSDTPSIVSRILPVVKRVISEGRSEVTLDDFRVSTDKGVTQEVKKQPHKSFAQTAEITPDVLWILELNLNLWRPL